MRTRRRHPSSLFRLLLLAALPLAAQEPANYLTGGDFEDAGAPLAAWQVSTQNAEVTVNRPAGRWVTVTVNFKSEDCKQVVIYIGAYGTPTGSCWVDNIRARGFTVKNPSFENLTAAGNAAADWQADQPGRWLHVSRERASNGAISMLYHDPAFAAQMIRLSQVVDVTPNTDYSYSYDIYLDDDFYGGIRCAVIAGPPAEYRVLPHDYAPQMDEFIADRAAAGYQQCRLELAGGTATIEQTAAIPAGAYLDAGIGVNTKTLEGSVTLALLDEAGQTLATTAVTNTAGLWEPLRLRVSRATPRVRFRVEASGTGTALLDGAYLGRPNLRPTPQSVAWEPGEGALPLENGLAVRIEGERGPVLTTGLEMLARDLEAAGSRLHDQSAAADGTATLTVRIGAPADDDLAERGPESYALTVSRTGAVIRAPQEKGAFYGIMTALQLIAANAGGQPVLIPCQIRDWPDLPWRALNRGATGLTPEWMARRKLNVAFHISLEDIPAWRAHGLMPIPHDNITHYPYHTPRPHWPAALLDPNMAEGRAGRDKLELHGDTPAPFSGRNVLRSTLADIRVQSLDGTRTYAEGYDYQVFPGETSMPFRDDAEPFAVARLPQGRIGDGETVVVEYEHVPPHTGQMGVLCLAEPGPQRALAAWTAAQVDQYNLPFFGLHVSEEPAEIGKGPRCRATGLSPSELMAQYYADLDAALKEANPDCRLITFVDDFLPWQHAPRSGLADAAALLPKDAIAHCWDYSASQAIPFNVKCAALWTRLGHEFLLTGWYDFGNLRTVAAAAKWARDRGMPCLGTSSWAYPPNPGLRRPAAFIEETAACAWRVPRPGEAGYVDPAMFDQALERLGTTQE